MKEWCQTTGLNPWPSDYQSMHESNWATRPGIFTDDEYQILFWNFSQWRHILLHLDRKQRSKIYNKQNFQWWIHRSSECSVKSPYEPNYFVCVSISKNIWVKWQNQYHSADLNPKILDPPLPLSMYATFKNTRKTSYFCWKAAEIPATFNKNVRKLFYIDVNFVISY